MNFILNLNAFSWKTMQPTVPGSADRLEFIKHIVEGIGEFPKHAIARVHVGRLKCASDSL